MSTYYSFTCNNCKLRGGFMSRQAWGVGNADLIDTYKFVMYHALNCGTDKIALKSEHEDDYDLPDTNIDGEAREKHLIDTKDIFPHTSDWEFMKKHDSKTVSELKKLWVDNEKKLMEDS